MQFQVKGLFDELAEGAPVGYYVIATFLTRTRFTKVSDSFERHICSSKALSSAFHRCGELGVNVFSGNGFSPGYASFRSQTWI
jgi:hypothetical protein